MQLLKYFMSYLIILILCHSTVSGSGKGNRDNSKVNVEIPITLVAGKNTIDLLSLTVGLQVHLFLL